MGDVGFVYHFGFVAEKDDIPIGSFHHHGEMRLLADEFASVFGDVDLLVADEPAVLFNQQALLAFQCRRRPERSAG